jgi:hypothetical protein
LAISLSSPTHQQLPMELCMADGVVAPVVAAASANEATALKEAPLPCSRALFMAWVAARYASGRSPPMRANAAPCMDPPSAVSNGVKHVCSLWTTVEEETTRASSVRPHESIKGIGSPVRNDW